ncbi:MAG: hypothetical protein LBV16_09315 [Elusimicrobiota bacterium]|jgi:hypothetical protein|nr:hypothetical protein [Elusimicrobiota bacterium]
MDTLAYTLIRKNAVVGRFIGTDTLSDAYIDLRIFNNESIDFEFKEGDVILANQNPNKRYIITSTKKLTHSDKFLKIFVLSADQYQYEKELNYGILKKQLLNFWRNSGVPNAIFTAILITIFLRLLDKLYTLIF